MTDMKLEDKNTSFENRLHHHASRIVGVTSNTGEMQKPF